MIEIIEPYINITSYNNSADYYMDIAFEALWDNIPITKSYIENILLIGAVTSNDIHKIGIAASELLENATKYSNKNGIHVIIKKSNGNNEIELSIINYTDQCHADKLMNRIEEINKADSFEYYIFRMKESVKNKEMDAGLGLARVYHESGAKISAQYDQQEQLIEVKAMIKI